MVSRLKPEVLKTVFELKQKPFGSVSVFCNLDGLKCSLTLMTSDCEKRIPLMELIGRWRKENEEWYLSQFQVSAERTTEWFKHSVTEAEDRLLFLINVNGDFIGHVGLYRFNFENLTCEIDNILRGEKVYPGVIGDSIKCLMEWGKKFLGLRGYSLKVRADNERALRLYDRLGFRQVRRIPLVCIQGKDGRELVEKPDAAKDEIANYYVVMEIK